MRTFGVAFSSNAEAESRIVRASRTSRIAERGMTMLPGLRTVGWRKTVTIGFRISETERIVTVLGVFYRGRKVLTILRKRER